MIRPSTKLLVAVFALGCAGGAALRESGVRTARAQGEPEKMQPMPPPAGPTFSYRVVGVGGMSGPQEKQNLFNQMGREGWRYAGAFPAFGEYHAIFERASEPVSPPPGQREVPSTGK